MELEDLNRCKRPKEQKQYHVDLFFGTEDAYSLSSLAEHLLGRSWRSAELRLRCGVLIGSVPHFFGLKVSRFGIATGYFQSHSFIFFHVFSSFLLQGCNDPPGPLTERFLCGLRRILRGTPGIVSDTSHLFLFKSEYMSSLDIFEIIFKSV